jgi:hypothetical protein
MIEYCIVEKEIVDGGLITGWGNGYIGLPKEHHLYGVDYHSSEHSKLFVNVSPHGGWTYSENWNPDTKIDDGLWWLGFDTSHFGDGKNWSEEKVLEHTKELAKEYETLEVKLSILGM